MATLHGFCDERFSTLQTLLSDSLDSGADLGASVAVTIDGELVVDTWGGWADETRTVEWGQDTITNVYSSTKTIVAISALILLDRGELDVDAPVAKYWPEFAANGKAEIPVKALLAHTSGLAGWETPLAIEDVYDWEKSTSLLAAQAPWWTPGQGSGYHALTYGHLIGEVIRRITGQKPGEFLASEITGPLGIDFHIGTPESEFGRISNIIAPAQSAFDFSSLPPDLMLNRVFSNPKIEGDTVWSTGWRTADIAAANGHGNARSVARINSMITNGGVLDGKQFLRPQTIERIFETQSDGPDHVLIMPFRFGIGFGLPGDTMPQLARDRKICFWAGAGGSLIVNVLDRNMTVCYVMNKMSPQLVGDTRGLALVTAAVAALE